MLNASCCLKGVRGKTGADREKGLLSCIYTDPGKGAAAAPHLAEHSFLPPNSDLSNLSESSFPKKREQKWHVD